MKRNLLYLFLVPFWILVDTQEDTIADIVAIENATSKVDVPEIAVDDGADADVDMPFRFLTIRQSYATPKNVTDDDEGVLSVEQLNNHAKLIEVLAKTHVEKFGANWTLSDFCFRTHPHNPDNIKAEKLYTILARGFPCNVVSPLDCFVEGGFVHGPYPPLNFGKRVAQLGLAVQSELDWTTIDPVNFWTVFHIVAGRLGNSRLKKDIKELLDILEKLKLKHGYSDKFCLDPENPRCPVTSINYDNSTAMINVGSILGSGCAGIIESKTYWPPNLFLTGFIQNSPGAHIDSAESLVTTILLANASFIFNKITDHPRIKSELDESAFLNEGIAGVESLISEWSNKTLEVLKNLARNSEFNGAVLDFTPDKEWIAASEVHSKLVQSATDVGAAWELMFRNYEEFEWIFNAE